MKDEDASRIAGSLDRIATGLDKLNGLLRRNDRAATTRIPNWAWVAGIIGVVVLVCSVMRTTPAIR
jgi:hypothetical protein